MRIWLALITASALVALTGCGGTDPAGVTGDPPGSDLQSQMARLSSDSDLEREDAAHELGERGEAGEEAAPLLEPVAEDPSHAVRMAAVDALGAIGCGRAVVALARLACVEDTEIALRALEHLKRLAESGCSHGTEQAVKALEAVAARGCHEKPRCGPPPWANGRGHSMPCCKEEHPWPRPQPQPWPLPPSTRPPEPRPYPLPGPAPEPMPRPEPDPKPDPLPVPEPLPPTDPVPEPPDGTNATGGEGAGEPSSP